MKNAFLFFVFWSLAALFQHCRMQKETPTPTPMNHELTYLALGDSYTIGEAVEQAERFPEQLADSLRRTNLPVKTVKIIAKTGWTTDELAAGILTASPPPDSIYDFVTLLIGVNNQYRHRSVEDYKPEFSSLLDRAIAFAGGRKDRVFVVSIPDYAFTTFGNGSTAISQGIDGFNAANRAIADAAGVAYFDITPISREGLAEPDLVAHDGLHPSGKQYARWVSLMWPTVKKRLE